MFNKILVPVDLTDKHKPVLATAASLAGLHNGQIILLHVIEVIAGLPKEEARDFYSRLEKKARSHLQKLGARLDRTKVSWRAEVLYGNRGREIVRYASASGADLVILTSPRLDPRHPAAGWASLSYKVGILSQCPVLLVK